MHYSTIFEMTPITTFIVFMLLLLWDTVIEITPVIKINQSSLKLTQSLLLLLLSICSKVKTSNSQHSGDSGISSVLTVFSLLPRHLL